MSHFVKLNGSFQQGPGKGDKKAVFFGLESHTMDGIGEFFPKNILPLFALKRPIYGLQMKAAYFFTTSDKDRDMQTERYFYGIKS